jgi:pimeloyl-ACP methyl ester carboxylesterase
MGIFLGRDSWGGDDFYPQTMNGFGYVYGNPVNFIDPSGNIGICFQGGTSPGIDIDPNTAIAQLCNKLNTKDDFEKKDDVIPGELSPYNKTEAAIEKAILEIIAAKKRNPNEEVVIIGYSWGGAAALELAQALNNSNILSFLDAGFSYVDITPDAVDDLIKSIPTLPNMHNIIPLSYKIVSNLGYLPSHHIDPIKVDKLILIDPVRLKQARISRGFGYTPRFIPDNVQETLNICAGHYDGLLDGMDYFWKARNITYEEQTHFTIPGYPQTYQDAYKFLSSDEPQIGNGPLMIQRIKQGLNPDTYINGLSPTGHREKIR